MISDLVIHIMLPFHLDALDSTDCFLIPFTCIFCSMLLMWWWC